MCVPPCTANLKPFILHLFIYEVGCKCHDAVNIKWQLIGVDSPSTIWGSRSNSDLQACWQTPLLTEPSLEPLKLQCYGLRIIFIINVAVLYCQRQFNSFSCCLLLIRLNESKWIQLKNLGVSSWVCPGSPHLLFEPFQRKVIWLLNLTRSSYGFLYWNSGP